MVFGDLENSSSEIHLRLSREASAALRPDLALNPGVRYQHL